MKYRIIETEIGPEGSGYSVWQVQSFRNDSWDVDPRTWDATRCGYFRDYAEALRRFNEIVYPKKPKVIIEVEV